MDLNSSLFFNLDSNPGQYFDQMSFYIYFLCYWAIENVTAGCDSLRGRLQKRREVKMNAGERSGTACKDAIVFQSLSYTRYKRDAVPVETHKLALALVN